jgi:hypothetical protein
MHASEFDEAEDVTNRALKLDKGHHGARIVSEILKVRHSRTFEGKEFERLSTLVDDLTYRFLKREFLEGGVLKPDQES